MHGQARARSLRRRFECLLPLVSAKPSTPISAARSGEASDPRSSISLGTFSSSSAANQSRWRQRPIAFHHAISPRRDTVRTTSMFAAGMISSSIRWRRFNRG